MAFRMLAAVLGAAGLGLWTIGPAAEEPPARTDPIVSASVPAAERDYTVTNLETGTACLISSGKSISARSKLVRPGSDCTAVWPGLEAASNWTRNDDGTVALTRGDGEAIVTLGLGDGVDYEALEPANAVLAVNAVN